jgi:hypothetical protein
MRGFLKPSVRHHPSDAQRAFQTLARHRRAKVASVAKTTLVKADQWGRGEVVPTDVAAALEQGLHDLQARAQAQQKKIKKP